MSKNTDGTSRWDSLERRRSKLFLVAGGLLSIHAVLWGIEVFANVELKLLRELFGPAGITVAFVGLLGLYPALANRTSWLARAAALFTVTGIVGSSVRAVVAGGQLVGFLAAQPAWVDPLQLPFLIGIVLGFITFGLAVLQTDAYSQSVGLLLLVPGVLFPVVLGAVITMAEGSFPYVIHVIHNGADALVLLGVGYLLRAKDLPTDRPEPAPETTLQ